MGSITGTVFQMAARDIREELVGDSAETVLYMYRDTGRDFYLFLFILKYRQRWKGLGTITWSDATDCKRRHPDTRRATEVTNSHNSNLEGCPWPRNHYIYIGDS